MRQHHTKTKGDLGLLHAMADLGAKGWGILVPITEHESFDVVAYRGDRFLRVQVKYRAAVNGLVVVPLSTCWADRKGTHTSPIDRTSIDVLCVYCPDTNRCYYVDPSTVATSHLYLRIAPTRNYQVKHVTWADDCLELPATVVGVSSPSRRALEESPDVRQSHAARCITYLRARSSIG